MKRLISLMLALVMVFGMVPTAAFAAETVTLQEGNVSLEGDNSFGTLLASQTQGTEGTAAESSCTITDLVIEGNTATVSYDVLENAVLVVAIYTEDGIQLLNSASAGVSAETGYATVTFAGEMPEYFMAAAYLADPEDCAPLCPAYETPMYTQVMQELLNSTVEDYDAELVMNFDEETNTNFAVYSEDTIQVESAAGVNTVVTADDENLVYVIKNADSQFTKLKKGDVVSYQYGEDGWLIVKVASVRVNGSTVTIQGDDSLTMEEVFSHVKLENDVDTSDTRVEDLDPEDGIEYVESDGPMLYAMDDDVTFNKSLKFKFLDVKNVSGSLDISLEGALHYYQSGGYHYNRFKITYAIGVFFSVSGKMEIRDKGFANLYLASIPFAGVMLSPSLDFSVSGKMEFSATVTGDLGINYASGRDPINLCTRPRVEKKWDFEGDVFFGIDLHPAAFLVHEKMFEVSLSTPIGATIEAKMEGADFVEIVAGTDQPEIHDCAKCLSGSCSIGMEVSASIKVIGFKRVSLEKGYHIKLANIPFYYSFTYEEFGDGTCPHSQYLVTYQVADTGRYPVEGVEIRIADLIVQTNAEGVARTYLPSDDYFAEIIYQDYSKSQKVHVNGKATKVNIILEDEAFWFSDYIGESNVGSVTDSAGLTASGTCGKDMTWTLYSSGLLIISGTGAMDSYSVANAVPWCAYMSDIKLVVISQGVESISSYAFYGCKNLSGITIPESVKYLGDCVFMGCSFAEIQLPQNLQRIGEKTFQECKNLQSIVIPDSITYIPKNTFANCSSLESVSIGASVLSVGEYAFSRCSKLTRVTGMDSLQTLGWYAFEYCTSLPNITLPDTLTSLGQNAFQNCTALTKISIPDSVTAMGPEVFMYCRALTSAELGAGLIAVPEHTFYNCTNLNQVKLESKIQTIGSHAFEQCTSLEAIDLPDSVTHIDNSAFRFCKKLKRIVIPSGVLRINEDTFSNCAELTYVELPDTVTFIARYAFFNCGLESMVIPEGVEAIEYSAFSECSGLTEVELPGTLTEIDDNVFQRCGLEYVSIPQSVRYLGNSVFRNCSNLTQVTFHGDAPTLAQGIFGVHDIFSGVTADVYYPEGNATWTQDVMDSYGGKLTWIPYNIGSSISETDSVRKAFSGLASTTEVPVLEEHIEETVSADILDMAAIYSGEYSTEEMETYTVKTASFSGLVPEAQYLLLALAEIRTETPLNPDNLLFIDQGVSASDGTLSFRYVPRVDTDISYVIACGPSNKNLSDAVITFPEMTADGELHAVNPVVKYGDQILAEGLDYELTGMVSYSEEGTFVCCVEGIHNYTGAVTCTYTVGIPEIGGVYRLAGDNRYQTAFAIADALKDVLAVDKFGAVVLANSDNFADALAGSYLAAVKNAPIIIAKQKYADIVCAYLNENLAEGATVYILGGTDVMPEEILGDLNVSVTKKRLEGEDRYLTNLEILREVPIGGSDLLLVTGRDFADSLSASATGLPILLVNGKAGKALSEEQKDFLATVEGNIYIIGGESAVPASMVEQIEAASGKGTVRIAGGSRYETSVKIAEQFLADSESAVVAYASTFPDGLCGGPLANAIGAPLILTKDGKTEAPDYTKSKNITSGYVLGSDELISDGFAKQIFGVTEILK